MIKPHGSSLLSFLCDSSWKAAIAETGIIASYSRSSLFFHESSAEHILLFIISRLSEDVENITCFFAELQTLLSWSLYCLLLPTEQCWSFFCLFCVCFLLFVLPVPPSAVHELLKPCTTTHLDISDTLL